MNAAGRIGFIAVVAIFLGWVLLQAQPRTTESPAHESASAILTWPDDSPAVSGAPAASGSAEAPETAESETDLYGNEVSDAVAEYGLDASGSLYEMHAPQVEVPKLGSPKS